MIPEITPHGNLDLPHEGGGFDLLAEAMRLDTSVRASIGLNKMQGNEKLKERLTREVSIGLVLGSRELGIPIPSLSTERQLEDGRPIAYSDWSEEKGGEIIFIRGFLMRFVVRMYRDRPFYFVVPHEMLHIRQLMDHYTTVRADLKAKDWKRTLTERAADAFGDSVLLRYGSEIQLALQGLPPGNRAR
ncbi:MAG: hypothetical protein A3B38_00760 [Candidatus Levybacteria bacterium RIFCSPLOWO2_01_FULL_36_13]|nr:MAG: hypothetical protein A2684_02000 [Candidatus Levybacteria bacterium RIFCSPHIGHO2_01_FULL_36_15b]OGH35419.1 MAG: hypothetical protein A3B38_00760 [Candidatus Levybacteria bacterium RIFCSPLOWO2_01_FULL_36_13]